LKKLFSGTVLAIILTLVAVGGILAAVFFNLNSTIPSTITVTAPPSTYTLTVNAGAGGTAAGGVTNVLSGTTSSISATANAGYHFTGWSGDYTGVENPYLITITSDMTVTANFTQDAVANLYSDLNCTVPVTSLDFGSVLTTGSPVTKIVYFKASRSNSVPGGYGFGEINPSTILVTSNINSAVASFFYMVGEPFGAVINGNHPCMITLTATPVGVGVSNFNVVITGNGP
jgi:uncharacterized repeat protein (TIGR02543 family)